MTRVFAGLEELCAAGCTQLGTSGGLTVTQGTQALTTTTACIHRWD